MSLKITTTPNSFLYFSEKKYKFYKTNYEETSQLVKILKSFSIHVHFHIRHRPEPPGLTCYTSQIHDKYRKVGLRVPPNQTFALKLLTDTVLRNLLLFKRSVGQNSATPSGQMRNSSYFYWKIAIFFQKNRCNFLTFQIYPAGHVFGGRLQQLLCAMQQMLT